MVRSDRDMGDLSFDWPRYCKMPCAMGGKSEEGSSIVFEYGGYSVPCSVIDVTFCCSSPDRSSRFPALSVLSTSWIP